MAKLPGTDVTNFIRGPTWVTYRVSPAVHLGRPSDEPNPSYLESEKKEFAENPISMRDHRRAIIGRSTKAFRMVRLSLRRGNILLTIISLLKAPMPIEMVMLSR